MAVKAGRQVLNLHPGGSQGSFQLGFHLKI